MLERTSMFILNEVETSHILISFRLYFILTILITEDGPQPSVLSDCNFNSSAGEVSSTQDLWEGDWAGTSVRDPESQERAHESLKGPIDIWFWFFHYYFFCIFSSNPQFWEKFQSVLGPQSSIVPPCKISLGDPGTMCWQIITFCNGLADSPSGNFSPGIPLWQINVSLVCLVYWGDIIISYFVYSTGQ
jgi:hypothetical protein